jgi:hypothetical protein
MVQGKKSTLNEIPNIKRQMTNKFQKLKNKLKTIWMGWSRKLMCTESKN